MVSGNLQSRDSAVVVPRLGAAGAMTRVLFLSKGKRFFSPLKLPDWVWRPPSFLFNG